MESLIVRFLWILQLEITGDEAKRLATLAERGLDFADAALVFIGRTMMLPDERRDCGEPRFITAGRLGGRFIVMVWTPRDGGGPSSP